MMYDFQVAGEMQRPTGCKGLDEPFGSLKDPLWVQRNTNSPIWNSPAMECNLNTYAPEGKPMHQIIEELASDNEHFAETFLEAFGMMASNGYSDSDLKDGPQNGWFGHYSLSQQGIKFRNFARYIKKNSPVTFTDKKVGLSMNQFDLLYFCPCFRLTHGFVPTGAMSIPLVAFDFPSIFKLLMEDSILGWHVN